MSEPIDLDLVELRCRLRGWTCERFTEDCADYVSVECKYGGELILGADGFIRREHGPAHKRIEALLLAPRWTLDRLLSEPPEGWRVVPPADPDTAVHVIAWGDDPEAVRVALGFVDTHGLLVSANVPGAAVGVEGLARLAERLRAAAELALILAEVAP